jgi:hypothetical protein
MSEPKKPKDVIDVMKGFMNASLASWAAEQGQKLGAMYGDTHADKPKAPERSRYGLGYVDGELPQMIAREPETKPVRYKMWQVGWEDEAFETGCDEDAKCPACEHERAGGPSKDFAAPGMVVFMAFHKLGEPERVEARMMEVMPNPLFPMMGPRFGWLCSTVSIEEAKRRQPEENPRVGN